MPRLPALTRFYPGLKPWDWERMTISEVRRYEEYMDAYVKANTPRGRGA